MPFLLLIRLGYSISQSITLFEDGIGKNQLYFSIQFDGDVETNYVVNKRCYRLGGAALLRVMVDGRQGNEMVQHGSMEQDC